jgi:hypothetical protein
VLRDAINWRLTSLFNNTINGIIRRFYENRLQFLDKALAIVMCIIYGCKRIRFPGFLRVVKK